MQCAEALYQRGILSYPRTETDQFDREFNFHEMIEKHRGDNSWGTFATKWALFFSHIPASTYRLSRSLLDNGGFERPRNGRKNDKAHPPIHPTAHVNNLADEEKAVYDLIVRRFLGCCSKNARGMTTTVEIEIAGEEFSASGAFLLSLFCNPVPASFWVL
jgi:DNA topoisomerase-3